MCPLVPLDPSPSIGLKPPKYELGGRKVRIVRQLPSLQLRMKLAQGPPAALAMKSEGLASPRLPESKENLGSGVARSAISNTTRYLLTV